MRGAASVIQCRQESTPFHLRRINSPDFPMDFQKTNFCSSNPFLNEDWSRLVVEPMNDSSEVDFSTFLNWDEEPEQFLDRNRENQSSEMKTGEPKTLKLRVIASSQVDHPEAEASETR